MLPLPWGYRPQNEWVPRFAEKIMEVVQRWRIAWVRLVTSAQGRSEAWGSTTSLEWGCKAQKWKRSSRRDKKWTPDTTYAQPHRRKGDPHFIYGRFTYLNFVIQKASEGWTKWNDKCPSTMLASDCHGARGRHDPIVQTRQGCHSLSEHRSTYHHYQDLGCDSKMLVGR